MAELALRDYQRILVEDIGAAWAEGDRRVVVALPTGGGKTEIATAIAQAEAATGGHTLFVVERKTLANQGRARFAKYGMLTSLLRGEDTHVRHYAPVTVASVQTLARRHEQADVQATLDRTTLIVIDEAHVKFKHHEVLFRHLPEARAIGFTATPLRDGLALLYQRLVRGPSYGAMIAADHLVRPRYFLPHDKAFSRALGRVKVSSTGDYVPTALSNLMRDKTIVGDVVDTWQTKAVGRPTIAFCVDKAHSRETCDALRAAGITAEHIEDRTPEEERAAIFTAFRRGDIQVLCSIGVLSLGFDEPSASCAILARPTLSLSLHIQQVGRVLRPHAEKSDCLVFNHAGNIQRHGRIEDFTPPGLSDIDKHTDRKRRADSETDYRPCPQCRAVMEPKQRVCDECGHELARPSTVHHVAGELEEHHGDSDPGVCKVDYCELYLQLRFVARERGFRDGWAYMKLRDEYGFTAPWAWRDLSPIEPTPKTLRLVRSWAIAYRKSQRAGKATDRAAATR